MLRMKEVSPCVRRGRHVILRQTACREVYASILSVNIVYKIANGLTAREGCNGGGY